MTATASTDLKLSPFLDPATWADSNDLAFAVRDGFPVSPGHTLVLPRRLVVSVFDLDPYEWRACVALLKRQKQVLADLYAPDGFNVGVNDGAVAGQTIGHAHIHLIPRFRGDHPNPRGGVRGVIPGKASY
jgi:diadenosine tetraphosphate (Ap4A) HIT family hydrolase